MSQFTIALPKYNKGYIFSRDKFLKYFPNSLISNILEQSSDTDIELTQPFITPDIIDILWYISEKDYIPKISLNIRSELIKAGDYLNMDLLIVIADPKWDELSLDKVITNLNEENMKDILYSAVSVNYLSLVDDILDAWVSKMSVLVNYLINQGCDPSYNNNVALMVASANGLLDIVNRLLQDPCAVNDRPIFIACQRVIYRLLQIPKVNPFRMRAFGLACVLSHIDVVKRLLDDPRDKQRGMVEVSLHTAILGEQSDMVNILQEWLDKN